MPENNVQAIVKYMKGDAVSSKLKEILGENAQSFVSGALQAVSNNDLLAKASPESVYRAVMASAVMKLPINQNLGHAYIVPYKGQAQLQIGWKGFVQLAIRSKQFATINTTEIYENQYEGEDYITGEVKIKNEKGTGKVVGYLAYFRLKDGFEKWLYMDKESVEKHAKKYSKSYAAHIKDPRKGGGVWADGEDGFDSMAKKTVLKLLLNRFAPLSVEMQEAVKKDQAVISEDDDVTYPDNEREPEKTPDEKKEDMRASKAETPKML